MFKKPIADLKTSAPLRSSDRRKLKQRIAQIYNLSPEDAELVVPDGLKNVKFTSHAGQPGVAYTSPDGDPLWFTIGKGSDELIPTVYTLWKKTDLLPFLTTPQAVIPKLIDGADLMIPGVASCSTPIVKDQLVSICRYVSRHRAPPLAIGKLAVDEATLRQDDAKGKAAIVWHTWKDGLWNLGKGGEPPEPMDVSEAVLDQAHNSEDEDIVGEDSSERATSPPPSQTPSVHEEEVDKLHDDQPTSEATQEDAHEALDPEEISRILREALVFALHVLSTNPPSSLSFPISSTIFYTSHILPYRPAYVLTSSRPADIKHSTIKSLSHFLKAAEKDGLLTLKSQKADVLVSSINVNHPEVRGAVKYKTAKDVEDKEKKKREREREDEKSRPAKEVEIREYWKPFLHTLNWFKEAGADTTALYTPTELRSLLNSYVASRQLINAHDQQFINVRTDEALLKAVTPPSQKGKSKDGSQQDGVDPNAEFMKREDIMKKLLKRMQPWYEIRVDGREGEVRKGTLQPITLTMKKRQNRKAVTLITGTEPFAAILGSAEDIAEKVRKSGFGTSVSALPSKPTAHEILVQGKQSKAVVELFIKKGVPKKWIEQVNLAK